MEHLYPVTHFLFPGLEPAQVAVMAWVIFGIALGYVALVVGWGIKTSIANRKSLGQPVVISEMEWRRRYEQAWPYRVSQYKQGRKGETNVFLFFFIWLLVVFGLPAVLGGAGGVASGDPSGWLGVIFGGIMFLGGIGLLQLEVNK